MKKKRVRKKVLTNICYNLKRPILRKISRRGDITKHNSFSALLKLYRKSNWYTQVEAGRHLGYSQETIKAWEGGKRFPMREDIARLAQLMELDPEELERVIKASRLEAYKSKLLDASAPVPDISIPLESGLQDMDARRRQLLQQTLGMTGAAMMMPLQELVNPDTLERLLQALKKPSTIDKLTLAHLSEITKHYWQMFAGTAGLARYSLLSGLSGHLQTITELLEYPLPTDTQNRLCILASETTQIIGEILFDGNESNIAEVYYNTAIEAAKNAQNATLQAVALGRKSFIPIYEKNPRNALLLLQQAHRLASLNAPDITRAWLSALEAEAHANNQDALSCSKALERSEHFLDRARPDETGYARSGESEYARFSNIVLSGYKGVCYMRLHDPEAAQKVLFQSMALMDNTRLRHKSIVLVDLAMTYIQQGEIEEAYRRAEEAIAIMTQTKSPRTFDRVLELRCELERWKTEQSVKNLDEQIATLRPYTSLWKR